MTDKYILDGKSVVPCPDLFKWGAWLQTADRHVAADTVGDVRISTVFLGLDHSHSWGEGPPLLFETMIFGGKHDGFQERYSTWNEAEAGHKAAVALVSAPPQ